MRALAAPLLFTTTAMRRSRRIGSRWASLLLVLALAQGLAVFPGAAGASEEQSGTLSPSYEPTPVPEPEIYTTAYLFAMSRALAGSTLVTAAKAPLFLLTIPLDTALLPIAAIAGFFPET